MECRAALTARLCATAGSGSRLILRRGVGFDFSGRSSKDYATEGPQAGTGASTAAIRGGPAAVTTMEYLSAISTSTDPYRAGTEIGEALAPIAPEVVLLFSSITYKPDLSDLFGGLADALDDPRVLVFGGTGDGTYETTKAANYAVAGLAMSSGGRVSWAAAVERGVRTGSAAAAATCTRRALAALEGAPDFCMVIADGSTADGAAIVEGVRSKVSLPIMGGLAGDDRKFLRSKVFLNGAEYEDAVAVLLGRGPITYAVNSASGWRPQGQPGVVVEAEGKSILNIDGVSPREFMTAQLGKPLGGIDVGVVSLAAYQEGSDGPYFLRGIRSVDEATGHLTAFGSIREGACVRVCAATREEVLQAVSQAVRGLLEEGLGFEPRAAVVLTCAGRKWLLEDRGEKELHVLFDALGLRVPLVGFPGFGEIGPYRRPGGGYTDSYFHNETFVLCLLGA